MKNIRLILLIFLIVMSSCNRDNEDICSGYVDAEYEYPPFPEDGWETDNWYEESKKLFGIPEQVLKCISTENLITSCLNYPQKNLFYAYDSWQAGFEVIMNMCNGFIELFDREDAGRVMVKRYLSMSPFSNNLIEHDFLEFEIFISQPILLSKLSKREKLDLAQHAIQLNMDKIKAGFQFSEGKIGGYVILARMMHVDNFSPFMEEFNKDSMVLLRLFTLEAEWFYNEWCKPDEIISAYASRYVEHLNQK
jgi:hypothetical protein